MASLIMACFPSAILDPPLSNSPKIAEGSPAGAFGSRLRATRRRMYFHGRVKTAKAVGASPAVRDAVESGRVSQANAKRLAEAIEKTSAEAVESDTDLLAKAASMRPEQFTKEARRWTADRQDDGGEADYRHLRARRRVRVWDTDDGTGLRSIRSTRRAGHRLAAMCYNVEHD